MAMKWSACACGMEFEAEGSCADGVVEIAVARLDLGAEAVDALSSFLSTAEQGRAQRCFFERDRQRFIVARARLRQLLAQRLGIRPALVEFAYGAHGKPRLSDRYAGAGWHFNLSHCAGVAVYAFSQQRRVGVDIEAVRAVNGADTIVAHYFSRRERATYRALAAGDRPLGFLNCWTRKEAFVKALGAGIARAYDRFDVSLAPGEPARLLRVDARDEDSDWRMDDFAPAAGFIAALVSERGAYRGQSHPRGDK